MLRSKTITLVCCIATAVMLVLALVIWAGKTATGRNTTNEMGYEEPFDNSYVHTIDIEIDDWESFISTATSEEYVVCDVTIDGEKIRSVGIRAKGNTSLSSVASQGSEKYSFKIEFDQYVDGRLYRGLDKLSLNNLIYDATMMKDYISYTLMREMGVPSPLCSFVEITVNGESWGLYLAVEGVEDGFLERNNMTRGELYKPDSLSFGGGRGNGRDFDIDQFRVDDDETDLSSTDGMSFPGGDFSAFANQMPSGQIPGGMSFPGGDSGSFAGQMPTGQMPAGQMPSGMTGGSIPTSMPSGDGSQDFSMAGFGGMFNFGMGGSDVKLQYIDDDFDSYSNIFDNAKTVITKADKRRLVNALKRLDSGEDIEDTVFTDEVISYLAVHDFLQNSDSYTGMMVHNYYLYEENGQLAIIPWDYNLAFGGFSGGEGTSLVNSPIDSPVANGDVSDRPLIGWIFSDAEALEQYHETYSRFISEYIESGWLDAEITRVAEMIRKYVAEDKNSFYTVEEFDAAVAVLRDYCDLRGQSIRGQLDGTIPSTTAGQRSNSTALVDASGLNVSVMGSMGGNGGGFGGGSRGSSSDTAYESRPTESRSTGSFQPGGDIPSGLSGFSGFSGFSGGMPDGASGFGGNMPSDFSGFGGDMPSGFSGPGPEGSSSSAKASWTEICIYIGILLAAIAAVVLFVRKHND